jgi:hypothetical protein
LILAGLLHERKSKRVACYHGWGHISINKKFSQSIMGRVQKCYSLVALNKGGRVQKYYPLNGHQKNGCKKKY